MINKLLILLSAFLFVACNSHEAYQGPRDEALMKELLIKRFAFNSLDAFNGRINVDTHLSVFDLKQNFSMLLDRKKQMVKISVLKPSVRSILIFGLSLTPKENIFALYVGDEDQVGWAQLQDTDTFSFLETMPVGDIRKLITQAWPPQGQWQDKGCHYLWGAWKIDKRSLVLQEYNFADIKWEFEYAKQPKNEGLWLPLRWKLISGNESLAFNFDQSSDVDNKPMTELNTLIEDTEFDVDRSGLKPLK